MASTFWGESLHKVDGKGRVSIPANFRAVLEENDPKWSPGMPASVVVHFGTAGQKHLKCYTMAAANEVARQVEALPRGSRERELLELWFMGHSQPLRVDETGRLVLSQKLRDKVGISDEAYFIASGDTFEIWAPAAFDAERAPKIEALLAEMPDGLNPLELLARAAPTPPAEGGEG